MSARVLSAGAIACLCIALLRACYCWAALLPPQSRPVEATPCVASATPDVASLQERIRRHEALLADAALVLDHWAPSVWRPDPAITTDTAPELIRAAAAAIRANRAGEEQAPSWDRGE